MIAFENWLTPLVGVSVLASVLLALTPEGGGKRIATMIAYALLLFAILEGAGGTSLFSGAAIGEYRASWEEKLASSGLSLQNEMLRITRESAGRMIEEKAASLGLSLSADCEAAVNELKMAGYQILGLDADTETNLADFKFSDNAVIAVGGEDVGLPPFIKKQCDAVLRIPMKPEAHSYNASVALSLGLYEYSRLRIKP